MVTNFSSKITSIVTFPYNNVVWIAQESGGISVFEVRFLSDSIIDFLKNFVPTKTEQLGSPIISMCCIENDDIDSQNGTMWISTGQAIVVMNPLTFGRKSMATEKPVVYVSKPLFHTMTSAGT